MKRRLVRTYKVLAVAMGATGTIACGGSVEPASTTRDEPARMSAPVDEAHVAEPAAVASAEPEGSASSDATAAETPPAPPAPPSKPDPKLAALRGELHKAGPATAAAQTDRFRPLCDKDGYPLVGNAVDAKGTKEGGYQPSAFCAEVRKNAAK